MIIATPGEPNFETSNKPLSIAIRDAYSLPNFYDSKSLDLQHYYFSRNSGKGFGDLALPDLTTLLTGTTGIVVLVGAVALIWYMSKGSKKAKLAARRKARAAYQRESMKLQAKYAGAI